jgi:hypothetical protein
MKQNCQFLMGEIHNGSESVFFSDRRATRPPKATGIWIFDGYCLGLLSGTEDGGITFLLKVGEICRTARRHIQEVSALHTYRCFGVVVEIVWITREEVTY